jgi:hypothetical protein
VSYSFNSYVRLYVGFKYFRYTWEYNYDDGLEGYYSTSLIENMLTVSDNYAPGIGCIFRYQGIFSAKNRSTGHNAGLSERARG